MLPHEFEEYVFPLKDRLFRFAMVWLRSREEAEDAVQDTLTRLWTMRSKLDDLRSIEAYAIRMVRNDCVNRQKSKHRKWMSLEGINEHMSDQQPEQTFQRQEILQTLLNFIGGLPEQQQLVIMLRDVEGMEISEIETIAEMTANNVRVTLSIARKKIAERYKAHEGYERK